MSEAHSLGFWWSLLLPFLHIACSGGKERKREKWIYAYVLHGKEEEEEENGAKVKKPLSMKEKRRQEEEEEEK